MYGRDIPLEYYTERGVEPPGLSFTSQDMAEWDEDDHAAARLAMEIDMADRDRAEVRRLKEQVAALQDYIRAIDPDYEE